MVKVVDYEFPDELDYVFKKLETYEKKYNVNITVSEHISVSGRSLLLSVNDQPFTIATGPLFLSEKLDWLDMLGLTPLDELERLKARNKNKNRSRDELYQR